MIIFRHKFLLYQNFIEACKDMAKFTFKQSMTERDHLQLLVCYHSLLGFDCKDSVLVTGSQLYDLALCMIKARKSNQN